MRYKLNLKILWLILSSIFLTQTFSTFSIFPIKKVVLILGLPDKSLGLWLLVLTSLAMYFIQNLIFEFSKEGLTDKRVAINFKIFVKAFLLVWITFFSYGILATFRVFPNTIDNSQILNWYMFWFFTFKLIGTTTYYRSKRFL